LKSKVETISNGSHGAMPSSNSFERAKINALANRETYLNYRIRFIPSKFITKNFYGYITESEYMNFLQTACVVGLNGISEIENVIKSQAHIKRCTDKTTTFEPIENIKYLGLIKFIRDEVARNHALKNSFEL
jgi:hypothetical protein